MTADIEDRPERWPVTATRDIYRGRWVVGVREDTVHRPGHPEDPFERIAVEHPGAVMALAIDEQERVCCVRQYRHVVGRNFVELPAGICDAEGEDPVETAKRELREEAELQAADWRHLLTLYPSVGVSEEIHHIYLARDLSPASRGDFEMVHEEAELERFWVPLEELLTAVLEGRVQQMTMATALLAYDALKRRGQL